MHTACTQPYTPAFHLDETEACTWICDGDQRIALYDPRWRQLDFWTYLPGQPLVQHPEFPRCYDQGTIFGCRAALMWATKSGNLIPDREEHTWDVQPDRIRLTVTGSYHRGGQTTHVLEIGYDAAAQQYRYLLSADFQVPWQLDVEVFNIYPARMLHSHPEQRRFTHTVWQGRDGRWKSFPHAVGLFITHVVGQYKFIPAEGGTLAWVTDPVWNPYFTVLASCRPLQLGTCDMWWDEHVIVPMPGMEERTPDGLYQYAVALECGSFSAEKAAAILAEAGPVPLHAHDQQRTPVPAFRLNEVCDFTQTASITDPLDTNMVWVPNAYVTWISDPQRVHSGQRALALSSTGPAQSTCPAGAVVQIGQQRRARMSAWINTERLHGEAWIELRSFRFYYDSIDRTVTSARVPAGKDWVCVEVEGSTGDSPYLHPFLWVEGSGEAVFDDVLYETL